MPFMDEGIRNYTICGCEHSLDTFRWLKVAEAVESGARRAKTDGSPGDFSLDVAVIGRGMAEAIVSGYPDGKTDNMLVEPLTWPEDVPRPIRVSDAAGYELYAQVVAEFERVKKKADSSAHSFSNAELPSSI